MELFHDPHLYGYSTRKRDHFVDSVSASKPNATVYSDRLFQWNPTKYHENILVIVDNYGMVEILKVLKNS